MRSFLTIFSLLVLLPTLASGSSVKGIRGQKRLAVSEPRSLKDKKCKKYKEPKAVTEDKEDPKAKEVKDKEAALKEVKADPKAADPKIKETPEPKASPEPKATPEPKLDPKETEEAECLEWEEVDSREDGGSDAEILTDPTMTSTGTDFDAINADCEAIANDEMPSGDMHSVSFSVNIDVLKEAEATLNDIYAGMEKELQQKVAPRIAGCSSSRFLEESSSSKIVHVDFGEMEFDHRGCDSSLAKEATQVDGVCMASDVPVDVYFVGDFPKNAMAKVEVAIEEHEWGVDGLIDTSEVDIVQTGSTMGSGDAAPGGMIGGIVAAVVACCAVCGCIAYKKSRGEGVLAKAELDTDEESSDDEKHKKVAVTHVQARAVR